MNMRKKLTAFLILTGVFAASCEANAKAVSTKDPFGPFNRAMYAFNDGLDHLILKPIAEAYTHIAPQPLVTGIHNFYNNLDTLPTIGNDLLQADLHQSITDTSRFLINTSLGILGFLDVSKLMGIPDNSEDMGLTFARWGWTSSTYVVLPFFGPSTMRDALGKPIDNYMSVYPYINDVTFRNRLNAMGVVNTRANLLQLQGVIAEAALDPYVFQRNAYLQHRNYLIERNTQLNNQHYAAANNTLLASNTPDDIMPMTAKQVASY